MPGEVRRAVAARASADDSAAVPVPVETPVGVAHIEISLPAGAIAAVVFVGHGAGGDLGAADLVALRQAALAHGVAVVGVRQPYRVLGRRAPAPARQLDAAWIAVIEAVRASRANPKLRRVPLIAAGRSSGARVACRTAAAVGANAVIALAFPLHPPGKPESTRVAELATGVPLLIVQGERDPFGAPTEFPPQAHILAVAGDHSLRGVALHEAMTAAVAWARESAASGVC